MAALDKKDVGTAVACLSFPFTITWSDGTQVVIGSADEAIAAGQALSELESTAVSDLKAEGELVCRTITSAEGNATLKQFFRVADNKVSQVTHAAAEA